MTLSEFQEVASEGVVVECLNAEQRRSVLELFEGYGYAIGSASRGHLRVERNPDTTFMHPGFRPSKGYVSCFRTVNGAKAFVAHTIQYEDVRNIIEHPPMLDERSDAEFASDFAALMC